MKVIVKQINSTNYGKEVKVETKDREEITQFDRICVELSDDKPDRILCVADIHGGYRGLIQALGRANYNPDKDQLITLGDYCDGWSETVEIIDYFISLMDSEFQPIHLKGNHDSWIIDWIENGKTVPYIQSTIDSYARFDKEKLELHYEAFFKDLLPYYIDELNRGFVHGGFTSVKGLGHELDESIYNWDRDMWQDAVLKVKQGKENRKHLSNAHTEVFIGHTTTVLYNAYEHEEQHKPNQDFDDKIKVPMNRFNIWNLDTGAGFNGRVTVMDVDTKQYWQSDDLPTLYPNEKGRNG